MFSSGAYLDGEHMHILFIRGLYDPQLEMPLSVYILLSIKNKLKVHYENIDLITV